jgi:hypothetical protein
MKEIIRQRDEIDDPLGENSDFARRLIGRSLADIPRWQKL